MLIGVVADTHIPKRAKDLPAKAYRLLEGVDAIVHAGDLLVHEVLDRLARFAPVYAVLGNNDRGLDLPLRRQECWEGLHVAVVHDSGQAQGRHARLHRWFPTADVVIFGHSHIPCNVRENGLLLLNPGSPTDRRRQPKHSMALLTIKDGQASAQIVDLD